MRDDARGGAWQQRAGHGVRAPSWNVMPSSSSPSKLHIPGDGASARRCFPSIGVGTVSAADVKAVAKTDDEVAGCAKTARYLCCGELKRSVSPQPFSPEAGASTQPAPAALPRATGAASEGAEP